MSRLWRNVGVASGVVAAAGSVSVLFPGDAGAPFLVASLVGSVLGSWIARGLATVVPAR